MLLRRGRTRGHRRSEGDGLLPLQLLPFYAETVLPMRDGLPKLKDFPKELGGSGEMVAE
jgi:hypothetical protein